MTMRVPAGRRFGRAHGDLSVTDDVAERLLRLPRWPGMTPSDSRAVIDAVWAVIAPRDAPRPA